MSEPLVVVGNGMAAARLVDELAKVALGRYAIAVIGDEPRLAYNRVLLSSVLAGETQSHDIELKPAYWWRERGVTLKYGCVATEIDVGRRELKIAHEESIVFSRLALATGSTALRLKLPGAELAGVHTFRDSRDVDLLLALAAPQEACRRDRRRIARTGGGLWSRQGRRTGDAGSSDGPPDGAPTRCTGRGTAEIHRRGQGDRGSPQCQHRAAAWKDACRRRRTGGRTATRRRCGDLRRRHPAERRACQGRRHCRQSRHRRRRPAADRRAGYFCAGRMRRASRHLLRPGRAGLRAGAGAGAASRGRRRQLMAAAWSQPI